jgi:hypothetical protein
MHHCRAAPLTISEMLLLVAAAPWRVADAAFDFQQHGCIRHVIARRIFSPASRYSIRTFGTYPVHLSHTSVIETTGICALHLTPIIALSDPVHDPNAFHEAEIRHRICGMGCLSQVSRGTMVE